MGRLHQEYIPYELEKNKEIGTRYYGMVPTSRHKEKREQVRCYVHLSFGL